MARRRQRALIDRDAREALLRSLMANVPGAIFDITERRANEEALRHHEVERARLKELRASQSRIIEAADAARRRIERDLHDGAQQHLVALTLEVRLARSRAERDPQSAVAF